MKDALRLALEDSATKRLLDALPSRRARAGGLTSGAASLLASALHEATGREVLLVTPHVDMADDLAENVLLMHPRAALLEPGAAGLSFEQSGNAGTAPTHLTADRIAPGNRESPPLATKNAHRESAPRPKRSQTPPLSALPYPPAELLVAHVVSCRRVGRDVS